MRNTVLLLPGMRIAKSAWLREAITGMDKALGLIDLRHADGERGSLNNLVAAAPPTQNQ